MFPGLGTAVNVLTVLIGSTVGVFLGHRIPQRIRDLITDGLGLVTLLIAGLSMTAVGDDAWTSAVGENAKVLIVLGSVVIGGLIGGAFRVESRLESFGGWIRDRLGASASPERRRFIEGFVDSSMVFCVGPLTILGSLSEGLGNGSDQLLLKASLDGFASIAFAASFGWGVAASAVSVLVIQGSITVLGLAIGDVLPDAQVAAITATGGILLVGVALRLLNLKRVSVGDFLPALLVAPLLTAAVAAVR
jgi:uncharacterized membrane protein YqgA involved in biofilm formation